MTGPKNNGTPGFKKLEESSSIFPEVPITGPKNNGNPSRFQTEDMTIMFPEVPITGPKKTAEIRVSNKRF